MEDDPRSRFERALDRAPKVAAEVDALSLEERERLAGYLTARSVLPPELLDEMLVALSEEERECLIDLRLVVAGTDFRELPVLDSTLLDAADAGRLQETAGRFAVLMWNHLGAESVLMLEKWVDEL